jgi:hypothetical protein
LDRSKASYQHLYAMAFFKMEIVQKSEIGSQYQFSSSTFGRHDRSQIAS